MGFKRLLGWKLIWWTLAGSVVLRAQGVGAPPVSFVFDAPSRSIRSLVGAPGSWWLGPPAVESVDFAVLSPDGHRAIARRDGATFLITGLGEGVVAERSIEGEFTGWEGATWSGDGSRAWIYSRSGAWIQEWSGWSGAPRRESAIGGSSFPGALRAIASDRDGRTVLVSFTGPDGGLFRWERESERLTRLVSGETVTGLVFGGDRFYGVDAAAKRLWSVGGAGVELQSWPLENLEDPVALLYIERGAGSGVVHVVGGKDRAILSWDRASGQVTARLELPVEPMGAERYAPEIYLLRPRLAPGEPAWCVGAMAEWTAFFVPAPREEGGK